MEMVKDSEQQMTAEGNLRREESKGKPCFLSLTMGRMVVKFLVGTTRRGNGLKQVSDSSQPFFWDCVWRGAEGAQLQAGLNMENTLTAQSTPLYTSLPAHVISGRSAAIFCVKIAALVFSTQ